MSLAEYQAFLDSLKKTKDPNEKILRDRLLGDVVPIIEQVEEAQQKKLHRREKELVVLQKLASAKRSSRLAGKHEKERLEREAVEEEHRQEAERIAERKKQEEQKKIEKERIYRLMTREQRLKDREEKRRKQEEELAAIAEQAQKAENGESRVSERNLKLEMAKREQDLAALQAEEDHWFFDCSGCGVHGVDLVCCVLNMPLCFPLTVDRMTAPTALLAKTATFGSTANVLELHKKRRNRMISISCAAIASTVWKNPTVQRYRP